jgi:hypothetical protein
VVFGDILKDWKKFWGLVSGCGDFAVLWVWRDFLGDL